MLTVQRTGEDSYRSLYNKLFYKSPTDTKKIKKFHEYTNIRDHAPNLVKSRTHIDYIGKMKYARPVALHEDQPSALGLGTFTEYPLQNTGKAIVRDKVPKNKLIDEQWKEIDEELAKDPWKKKRRKETLDELLRRVRWISNTHREERPYCLPIASWEVPNCTWEENSDMIRYRPERYAQTAKDWQTASSAWNRVQLRPGYNNEFNCCDHKQNFSVTSNRQRLMNRMIGKDPAPFTMSNQCKERKLPGYAGFVPREPVASSCDPISTELYRSSTNRAFRQFPHDVMYDRHSMNHHCVAPMSRMITLVYPSNPYKRTPNVNQTFINTTQR